MTSIDSLHNGNRLIRNGGGGRPGRDPLPRLLTQLAARAGDPVTIERAASRPWASALFQGRRHIIALQIGGLDAAERCAHFLEGLEEAQWRLTGHFVADISVDASRSTAEGEWIELSALTIEDW